MADWAYAALFVATLGCAAFAGEGCCDGRGAQHELDALGEAVAELETVPIGAVVKFEGELRGGGRTFASSVDDQSCNAYDVVVDTISSTTDSDDDKTYWSTRNYSERRGPEALHFERGRRRLALPLEAWNAAPSATVITPTKWPPWLNRKYGRSFRGSFESYRIGSMCLVANDTYFVTGGKVAAVTDVTIKPEPGTALLEVAEPIIWLGTVPGAVLWPGTERARVRSLTEFRDSNVAQSWVGAGLAVVFGFALVLVFWRSH